MNLPLRFMIAAVLCIGALRPAFAQIDFRTDVEPIFREKCWECHGPDEQESSLRLDKKKFAMVGGTREQIIPGAPEKSRLYRSIAGLGDPEMPQDGTLSAAQIETIRQWIQEGAAWPDDPPDIHWVVDPRVAAPLEELKNGHFAAVQSAVIAQPELARAQDIRGVTLLSQAALYGNAGEIKWLLSHGADPNIATEAGHTPLMLGIDDLDKVKLLLDAGADISARTQAGRTTLQQAADIKRNARVIGLLLRHGAKAEPGEGDPLVQVSRNGDLESMKLLAAQRGGKFPKPAVKAAALSNCLACLRLVLAAKPDEQAIRTALVGTATMINNDVLSALLKSGADANAPAAKGASEEAKTVLMQAVYSDYAPPARVRLLIDFGADVNARSANGNTALLEARKKGSTEIVAMLIAAGAKE
ncbi:MAG: ankyrin repeat domain-containing protein [Gammaproteobacteria bacterium]